MLLKTELGSGKFSQNGLISARLCFLSTLQTFKTPSTALIISTV